MSEESADARAAREAAQWLARLNSLAVTTEDLNAFYEWRRAPANAAAYAKGEQMLQGARGLGEDPQIAQAVHDALERPRREGTRMTRRALVAGGGVLAALAAGGAWWFSSRGADYRTAVGEQLLVSLDDGSRMRLNTDSAARVRFSNAQRLVELLHGQALFEVERDAARPFRVESRDFAVTALGTRFEVAAIGERPARVLLVEGQVAVSAGGGGAWQRTLRSPGDALTIAANAAPSAGREDVGLATGWTTGRLTFRSTPIAAAVAEVNRYARVQIVLEAPEHAGLRVDGVFETGDPDAFVAAVTALFPLRARRAGADRIVLSGA
jgi:transmembrane sensor